MKIKILSDSTCDLTGELIQKHDIGIVPLIVMKDDQEYYDGITINPSDIFGYVASSGKLCSTAARSVLVYQETFAKYADDYDGVLHISLGSGFSSSYQNACIAADEFDNVRVVDSSSLSCGQGLIALKAWELAQTVSSLDELQTLVEDYAARMEGSFVLEHLDYLVKGGRCSGAAALGANLLNLKPCIELKDGKLGVGKKYRGQMEKCVASYVKERLNGREDLDQQMIFLAYSGVSDACIEAARAAIKEYSSFENVYENAAGCTISCHCGPGTLGIMFAKKV